MRRLVRAASVLAIVLVAVAIEVVLQPAPTQTLAAMVELGPVDGWRCVHESTFVYDPHWPRLPGGLLAQPPEKALAENAEPERIEVDLRTGDAIAWTRTRDRQQRVYELRPGIVQAVGTTCVGHLAGWHVISEHSLG